MVCEAHTWVHAWLHWIGNLGLGNPWTVSKLSLATQIFHWPLKYSLNLISYHRDPITLSRRSMDNATKSSLFHVALLLAVVRGYMFSSTTPAGKCMNHVSQTSGPGRKGSPFGDDIAKDDIVHDSRKGILLRLAPSIKHIQVRTHYIL